MDPYSLRLLPNSHPKRSSTQSFTFYSFARLPCNSDLFPSGTCSQMQPDGSPLRNGSSPLRDRSPLLRNGSSPLRDRLSPLQNGSSPLQHDLSLLRYKFPLLQNDLSLLQIDPPSDTDRAPIATDQLRGLKTSIPRLTSIEQLGAGVGGTRSRRHRRLACQWPGWRGC